jgi:hypothetical protein
MGNLSVINMETEMIEACSIVSDFIRDDLFKFYCPFDQPIADGRDQQSTGGKFKRSKSAHAILFKTTNFQNYLVNNGYLEFFEFMTNYESWTQKEDRTLYSRLYVPPTGLGDSYERSSSEPVMSSSEPVRGSIYLPQNSVAYAVPVPVGGPGGGVAQHGRRTWASLFNSGRSRKKNKHNTTKKYRTKRRTSIQSRHVKHKHTRNIRTIKRRKNRRNNRSIRK